VHITAVSNNATLSIYQNGYLVSTAYNSNLGADSNCNLTIGNSANYEPFYGALDDVRIYNRELNQSEITYLANH